MGASPGAHLYRLLCAVVRRATAGIGLCEVVVQADEVQRGRHARPVPTPAAVEDAMALICHLSTVNMWRQSKRWAKICSPQSTPCSCKLVYQLCSVRLGGCRKLQIRSAPSWCDHTRKTRPPPGLLSRATRSRDDAAS
jgi:hypothetical protein